MNEVQAIKSREHIAQIKSALQGRDLLLFVVGINSALRISDLLSLTVGELRSGYVTLNEGKTGKLREFPLNDSAVKAVAELIASDTSDDEYAFPSRKSARSGCAKSIGRVQAYRILNNAVDRAGLADVYRKFGAHSLRKTFGYFAYSNNVDITLLMRVLNHSSQRETLRYIGIEQEQVDDVYFAVNL